MRNQNNHRWIREFMEEQNTATTREIYNYFKEKRPSVAMTMNRLGSLLHANKWVEVTYRGNHSETTTWAIKTQEN